MRIEIIREKGDTLQEVINSACACRTAFKCLVVTVMDGLPRPLVQPAEIPFDKAHLRNQEVWARGVKPGMSPGALRTMALICAAYAVIAFVWYLGRGRIW